jgi:modification methylase
VLKDSGTIWVIGSYHNIYRIGMIMQDLGFWFLNDVVWVKLNPMPNFRGVRFTNAHETLLWASKAKGARYTFNHTAMKAFNEDKQMRSDWVLPICSGAERLRVNGKKAHPTQKPEALLYRVILSSSQPDDVVLDPFFGTGTTGVVARKLHRKWIGIEREPEYVRLATERISAITPELFNETLFDVRDRKHKVPRLPFTSLLEYGLLKPGQTLTFRVDQSITARIRPDGKLALNGYVGSIHQLGKQLMNGSPCNGWENWCYDAGEGDLRLIDDLRQELLRAQQVELKVEEEPE